MTLPKWNDPKVKAGTMVRTALWMISEVGVGNIFTKEQHRKAFSGIAQADRRMRDLRSFGWVIHTNLEDISLTSKEQRFVTAGLPVWEPGVLKASRNATVSAKVRRQILAAADYQCVACGIAGGEKYPDSSEATAVLSVSRSVFMMKDGRQETGLLSQCTRCAAGDEEQGIGITEVIRQIHDLPTSDLAVFIRWTERGRRDPLDRAWSTFRRLPSVVQDEVRQHFQRDPDPRVTTPR